MVTAVKNRFGYDDSLDAFGVHGIGGLMGCTLTGVLATRAVNPALKLATGAAAQQNVLVLYGSPDRDWVAAIANKFEKDTGMKVQWIRASSNEMYAKIEAEKANPQGDVWFGGTGDPHFAAAEAGLTEPYCSPKMSELREFMRDPLGGCRVIGLYAGPLGWAVNEGVRM
mgnify:CR=1 FL=1